MAIVHSSKLVILVDFVGDTILLVTGSLLGV